LSASSRSGERTASGVFARRDRWSVFAGAAVASVACVALACRASGPDVGASGHATASATAATPADSAVSHAVVFERVRELPAVGGGSGHGFERACAMRLQDPRDGREYLLRKSVIATPTTQNGGTTVMRLKHALGDYAPIGPPGAKGEQMRLRVDCVTGQPMRQVAPGA
jgi:hypothetical protein